MAIKPLLLVTLETETEGCITQASVGTFIGWIASYLTTNYRTGIKRQKGMTVFTEPEKAEKPVTANFKALP
jgi:hypothetical protein